MTATRTTAGAGVAIALAIALTSCQDGVAPSERFSDTDRPPPPALDHVLGGDAALEALAALIAEMRSHGRLDEVPEEAHNVLASQALARGPRTALVPSASLSTLPMEEGLSGPYVINGVTYYEKGGVLYPQYGTPASIMNPYTTGILAPGYAKVSSGFEFTGDKATQSLTWKVTNPRTGVVIRSAKHNPFGSATGTGTFKRFVGHVEIFDLPPCDIALSGGAAHSAWNSAGWILDNITINSVPVVGVTIRVGTFGKVNASSGLYPEKQILCTQPPDECEDDDDHDGGTDYLDQSVGSTRDGALHSWAPTSSPRFSCGGDGGGFGDEPGCTVCQQWFTVYYGKIIAEWWECHEGTGNECDALMR